jgi:hypothetical protein
MKKTLALAFTLVAVALVSVTAGEAFATTHAKAPSTLKVVMRDPGCHWFAIGGKFALKATVAGPVRVTNLDEATLLVTGNGTTRKIPVLRKLLVTRGHYVITMVGQASDDNHLELTVK